MVPICARQPPHYCPSCGAPFPWADRRRSLAPSFRAQLENLLRRLPLVLRQLRTRSGERPPIAVQDERDLEDVVRALLPLYFDDIRPTARTPRYASFTRTDFLLAPQHIAVTVKLVPSHLTLAEQIREDAAYWHGQADCRLLMVYVHDPECKVREPAAFESACSAIEKGWEVRCVVA